MVERVEVLTGGASAGICGIYGLLIATWMWGAVQRSETTVRIGSVARLAPFTIGERAWAVRVEKPQSWYLDLGLLGGYAGAGQQHGSGGRTYHHTAPTAMVVSLHAGLRRILDEGLENVWARHAEAGRIDVLGSDPATGKPVLVRLGKFGPIAQIGSPDDEESVPGYGPRRGSAGYPVSVLQASFFFSRSAIGLSISTRPWVSMVMNPSPIDRSVIRMLYDRRIGPGTSRRDALRILRGE